MKITKISQLIKALEYSKENLQSDDLSEVMSVQVSNQAREDGVDITDPAFFSEDDGDPSISIKIVAVDALSDILKDDEPSRMGREWY